MKKICPILFKYCLILFSAVFVLVVLVFYKAESALASCDGDQLCGVTVQVCDPPNCDPDLPGCTCTYPCQYDGSSVGCSGTTKTACFLNSCANISKCQVSEGSATCIWRVPSGGDCSVDPCETGLVCSGGVCAYPTATPTPTNTPIPTPTTPPCSNTFPDAPSLTAPANGTALNYTSVNLQFSGPGNYGVNCGGNSNSLKIYYCTGASCSPNVFIAQVGTGTTSYPWSLPSPTSGTIYGWHVRASNGALESNSSSWYFTYDTTPPVCSSLTTNAPRLRNGDSFSMTAIATDNVSVKQIDGVVSSNTAAPWSMVLLCSNASLSGSPASLTCPWTVGTSEGSHKLGFNVADSSLNVTNYSSSTNCQNDLCVDDTAPVPVISSLTCSALSGTASDTPACSNNSVNWVKYSVRRSSDGVIFGDYWNASTNSWGASEVLNPVTGTTNWNSTMPGSGYYYRTIVYADDGLNTSSGTSQNVDCRPAPTATPIPTSTPTPIPTNTPIPTPTNSPPTCDTTTPTTGYIKPGFSYTISNTSHDPDAGEVLTAIDWQSNACGTLSTTSSSCSGNSCTATVVWTAKTSLGANLPDEISCTTTAVPRNTLTAVSTTNCQSTANVVAPLTCIFDLYGPDGNNYGGLGAWHGAIGFKERAICRGPGNVIRAGGFCLGWDAAGTCTASENQGENTGYSDSPPYSLPITNINLQQGAGYSEATWNVPTAGDTHCMKVWARPRTDGVCNINNDKSTFFRDNVPLWDEKFVCTSKTYTVNYSGGNTYIAYVIGLGPASGYTVGVKAGERAELWSSQQGSFCSGVGIEQAVGGGPYFTCTKEVIGTKTEQQLYNEGYLSGLSVRVADQRWSESSVRCDPPAPPVLNCSILLGDPPGSGNSSMYTGDSQKLTIDPINDSPPNTFNWTNASCGTMSPLNAQTTTFTAKTSGGALLNPPSSCTATGEVRDNSSQIATCSATLNVDKDFSISVGSQSPNPANKGNEAAYTVTVTAINGWSKPITLSTVNCPTSSGITCKFGPSRTDTYSITPGSSVSLYVKTSSSTTCGPTTYSGIKVHGEVTNASDPSFGFWRESSTFNLTCQTVTPFCTMSAAPASVYSGASSSLNCTPNPASPPSGSASYNYSWTNPPSCGQFNPSPGNSSTATWEAKSGITLVAPGSSCRSEVTITDPGSGASSTGGINVDVPYDFSLSVSPPIITVNRGQSASYTVAALAINGWSRAVNLSIDSIKDENNQSYSCSDLANSCTFATNPITPGGPTTTTLSFNTIKQTAPYHTYTIVVRGTDSTSGFYRDSNSFNLVITDAPVCAITPASSTVYPGDSDKMNVTINGGSGSFTYSWTANCGRFSATNIKEPDWVALTSGGAFFSNSPSTTECYPTLTITDQETSASSTCSTTVTERDFSMSLGSASATQGQICKHTASAGAISGWSKQIELSETCPSGTGITCYYSLNSDCSTNNGTTMNVTPTATRYLCVSSSINTPSGNYSVSSHGEVKSAGDPSNGFYHDASATCTFGCAAPDVPTSLSVDSVSTNSATVSWTAPATGPVPDKYGIQWALSSSSYGASITETSSISYTITGLTPGLTYKWHVRSQVNNCGNSNWVDGPSFTTSSLFTCYVDPASGTVAPGETINPVTTKGSSSLIVTSWAAPSCGVLNASAPTNPVTWTAKNALGADLPDGSVCNINSNADTNPAGQSASCTKATYTVSAPQYCCDSVLNACCVPGSPTCSCPGGQPSSSCAGKTLGAWCGTGGASYDFTCSGVTPRTCSVSTDGTCTFSATGWAHGVPFVYRFGVSPNTTPREETSLTQWEANGYYNILPGDYSANNAISFKIASEKYLDRVEVILKALAAADPQPPAPTPTTPPRYIGSKVWAAIYNPSGTMVAEAMSNIPSGNPLTRDPGWGTVTFDFKVEPLVRANQFYKLNIRSYGKFETREGWEKFQYNGPLTKKFWFRDVPSSGGVGTFANGDFKTGDICYSQGTCSVVYTPPDSSSLASFNIGAEVSSSDDVCYNCGGNTCGCQQGKFTVGCAVLGTATVTADAWWQGGTGGDIYGLAGVSSAIPAAPTPYLIWGVPGIAMSGTSQLDTNGRDISQTKNWRVTNYVPKGLDSQSSQDAKGYSYNYFYNKLKDKVTQTFTDASDPKLNNILPNLGGSPPAIVLVDTGTSVTVKAEGEYNKGTAIVLINGNLNITKDVTVDGSSALMFIVNGDITMDPTLVTKIEGIYFAQRAFSTGSSNKRIIGNGAWYVAADPDPLRPDSNRKFNFGRDLGASNTSTPAEQVNFQPKYLLKLMDLLGETDYVWQEVAG